MKTNTNDFEIPVIDSDEYQEYQDDEFQGFAEMFEDYESDVVMIQWDDGQINLKIANWQYSGGSKHLMGINSRIVTRPNDWDGHEF